jgi:hypothetical protein
MKKLCFEEVCVPFCTGNNDSIKYNSSENVDVNGLDSSNVVKLDFDSVSLNDRSKRYFESDRKGQGTNSLVTFCQMKVSYCEVDHYHK